MNKLIKTEAAKDFIIVILLSLNVTLNNNIFRLITWAILFLIIFKDTASIICCTAFLSCFELGGIYKLPFMSLKPFHIMTLILILNIMIYKRQATIALIKSILKDKIFYIVLIFWITALFPAFATKLDLKTFTVNMNFNLMVILFFIWGIGIKICNKHISKIIIYFYAGTLFITIYSLILFYVTDVSRMDLIFFTRKYNFTNLYYFVIPVLIFIIFSNNLNILIKKVFINIIIIFSIILFLYVLVKTDSKSAMIALGIGIAYQIYCYYKLNKKITLLILCGAIALLIILPDLLYRPFFALFGEGHQYFPERAYRWYVGLKSLSLQNIFTGQGYLPLKLTMHNLYMTFLVERGIFGLISFLLFMIMLIKRGIWNYYIESSKHDKYLGMALTAGTISFFLAANTSGHFFICANSWFVFGMLYYLTTLKERG